uniref:LIM zinc-binding domain-containing protein n=1 Tax=Heterorhabditis bacteriophora TaxID=37862 RepID=A0A1I7XKL4_HETBA
MAEEEDPYAVSSDSEDEDKRKPPPKIQIEGRENADINQLDFEEGNVTSKVSEDLQQAKAALEEERLKLTEIGKASFIFAIFFLIQEKLKRMEKEMIGLGKESLISAKERFEKGVDDSQVEREKVEIERSADMDKVKAAFNRDMTADEAPKDCAVCSKIVYPVERVFANKMLYHIQCFKCNKCNKKLTPTHYNSHQGVLLCKVHMLEVFHPELAQTMDPQNTEG